MIKERFDLSGKAALVVGGRGYLGSRSCAALNECGAKVYSADLVEVSQAAGTARPLSAAEEIAQLTVDVTDPQSVRRLVEQVLDTAKRIDILLFCVTAKPKGTYLPFTECPLEGWQTELRVELDGLFVTAQQVGIAMEKAGCGNIILMSSMYGVVGNDQRIYEGANLAELYGKEDLSPGKQIYAPASYAAAKGAVISLTRFLAAYWEGRNIRVNCLSPGGVAHPGENEAFVKRYSAKVPLGRKANIEEIVSAVVFLASDASSYVNGHNLIVDGGWTIW
jgi:NAD(P)-dependent dehydrogenase (short-subunit alcohol dehydrogenase family)